MKKGSRRKTDIQQATKNLIREKGYPSVTMSDVSQRLNLSVGGLYYHYHSVEEIFFDIVAAETGEIWDLFDEVSNWDDLTAALNKYFEIEKADLLNVDHTLNSILYQYYFSFPAAERRTKIRTSYQETINNMSEIFKKIYSNPQTVNQLCDHIYVMLHGLNVLAMSGEISSITIDREFKEAQDLMYRLYIESKEQ